MKKMKTKEELKQLAMDIIDGKVFGSWMIKDLSDIPMVFMVSVFMKKKDIPKDLAHFYEYNDKAGRMSVNGMPCFFSAHILLKKEAEKLQPLINEYREQKEKFLRK